ncbi:hypothetical protein ACRALDRAFT_210513 [Sodiomyces alcalophilus JCM 7366]|uniref:uncharacterized protein n=1 Tax=Sodiomyces alcalophilus JCM 7366 TaxID=591952 RepID=UPI0039B3DC6C
MYLLTQLNRVTNSTEFSHQFIRIIICIRTVKICSFFALLLLFFCSSIVVHCLLVSFTIQPMSSHSSLGIYSEKSPPLPAFEMQHFGPLLICTPTPNADTTLEPQKETAGGGTKKSSSPMRWPLAKGDMEA